MVLWAVEPADVEAAGAPWWVVLALGIWAVVAPTVSAYWTYRGTTKATKATAETAADTNALASSKSDRELIMQALELARSDDPKAQRQGDALLEGLATMPGLSQKDALLVMSVTREVIEPTLSDARRAEEVNGAVARFVRRFRAKGGGKQ